MDCLTPNQTAFLHYVQENGFSNIRRIQRDLDYKSPNSVLKVISSLIKRGYVEKKPNHKCESCGGVRTTYALK